MMHGARTTLKLKYTVHYSIKYCNVITIIKTFAIQQFYDVLQLNGWLANYFEMTLVTIHCTFDAIYL